MSSAFIAVNFNRTDMPEPRRIDQVHTNGEPPAQNGDASLVVRRVAKGGKRRIDCCQGRGEAMDPATRVGDGYKRASR